MSGAPQYKRREGGKGISNINILRPLCSWNTAVPGVVCIQTGDIYSASLKGNRSPGHLCTMLNQRVQLDPHYWGTELLGLYDHIATLSNSEIYRTHICHLNMVPYWRYKAEVTMATQYVTIETVYRHTRTALDRQEGSRRGETFMTNYFIAPWWWGHRMHVYGRIGKDNHRPNEFSVI